MTSASRIYDESTPAEDQSYGAPALEVIGSIEDLTLGDIGPVMDGINENMPSQTN